MIADGFLESRLVREAQLGEHSAVEALVLRYQRKAHAVARAITVGSAAEPDDIVQEAFLQALRDLPRLRQPESFGRWLLQIVRNVARRTLRKEPITVGSGCLDTQAAAPRESLEHAELRACLWREVRKLPEGTREAIFLYYYEGESVRTVAAALETSVAAVKKRLQTGRELLRDALWRELRETLRDLLPGARAWERRGRRLTLLLLAALPAGATPVAAAAFGGTGQAVGTGVLSGASSNLTSSGLVSGGLLMTKGSLVVTAAAAVVSLGATMWFLSGSNENASPPSNTVATVPGAVSPIEHRTLLSRYENALSRLHELESENANLRQRLKQGVTGSDSAKADAEGVVDSASPASSSGIDWSGYTRLLKQNLQILDRSHLLSTGLTEEERAGLTALEGELLRISARARVLSPAPLFNAAIFGELMRALFKDSLGLNDKQFATVERANSALFEALPEDLASLTPLERFRLKQRMAYQVWDAIDGVLDEEQRQHWELIRKYSERLFLEGQVSTIGLDLERPDGQILSELWNAYSLTAEQSENVKPWVPEYIQSARQLVSRFAASKEELEVLPLARRQALEAEFLDLQERYERQIVPLLTDEQRRKVLGGEPRILHFTYGNFVMGNGYGSGLF